MKHEGRFVDFYLQQIGMTQRELAKRAEFDTTHISRSLKKAVLSAKMRQKFEDVLNLPADIWTLELEAIMDLPEVRAAFEAAETVIEKEKPNLELENARLRAQVELLDKMNADLLKIISQK